MNVATKTAASPAHLAASRTNVVALAENDLAEIAGFIASQSGRSPQAVEDHLRWFLLQNPAREPEDPLGFGLRSPDRQSDDRRSNDRLSNDRRSNDRRSQDRLVGCILCSPQTFRIGDQIIHLMGSSSFYVEETFRGQGARIFLRYTRIPAPLFGSSANADAAALWKAAGATPIPFSDGELFGVLHWPPVAEEFAHRKHSHRLVTRLASSPISNLAKLCRPLKLPAHSSTSLRLLTSPEQVGKLLNDLPENDFSLGGPSQKLTALRDLRYIRWRYFSAHDETTAAFAFRSRSARREILVTVNIRQRGYRGQINVLNLLDVYPEASCEEWLEIVSVLAQRYRSVVDAIVLRNQNPERKKLLCSRGFLWRAFDASTGWFLDKVKRLPAQPWYSVPADGDALI